MFFLIGAIHCTLPYTIAQRFLNFAFLLLTFNFRYMFQQAAVVDDVEGEVGQRVEADFRAGGFVFDCAAFVVDFQLVAVVYFFEGIL